MHSCLITPLPQLEGELAALEADIAGVSSERSLVRAELEHEQAVIKASIGEEEQYV